MSENGAPKHPLAIQVLWDADLQRVGLQFNAEDFKTWEMLQVILQMAALKAEDMKKAATIQAMQEHAAAQAQSNAIIAGMRGR